MISKILAFALAVSSCVAFPRNINQYDYLKCPNVMQAHHLTRGFPGVVAHGLHSITLEDLQYYFDASAKEDNHVPTINLDLVSEHAVLGYAPSVGLDRPFPSQFMRAVDQVLSHMDDPNYDVKKYSTLERLVHVMHMNEMWKMAKPHYDKLVANPPKDPRICPCVNDVENNGIMDMLNFMALKIREPELMYGHHLTRYEGSDRLKLVKDEEENQKQSKENLDWEGNLYKFEFKDDDDDSKAPKASEELDWDDIIYHFGKDGQKQKQKPMKENLDWEGNLYKFDFKDDDAKKAPKGQEDLDWDDIIYHFGKDGQKQKQKPMKENLDWEGNLYKFDFKDDDAKKAPKGQEDLDWDDIIYHFGKDGQKQKQKPMKENLDWEGNLYKFDFKDDKDEDIQTQPQKHPKEQLDWEGNLYKFDFKDDKDEGAKPQPHKHPKENLDWEGNLYKFDFKDDDDDTVKQHPKNAPQEKLDWEGNLYKFEFKDDEQKQSQDPQEKLDIDNFNGKDGQKNAPKSIQKRSVDPKEPTGDNFAKQKGMPKLNSEAAWRYWKNEISGMEETSDYELAMFLYCALNHKD